MRPLTESFIVHHHHVPVELILNHGPVKNGAIGDPVSVVPGLDHAPGEHKVPHIQIGHLSNKALHGLQASQVFVRVLPQEDGAFWTDRVPRFVNLVGAAFPLHPKGCEAGRRLPGQTEAGAEGGEGRQVKEGPVTAQIEGDASVLLTPNVELVVVIGAVGKQDDLPLLRQISGHTHAQSEGAQLHLLLRDQGHEAEVRLIRKDQDFVGQTRWSDTNR